MFMSERIWRIPKQNALLEFFFFSVSCLFGWSLSSPGLTHTVIVLNVSMEDSWNPFIFVLSAKRFHTMFMQKKKKEDTYKNKPNWIPG